MGNTPPTTSKEKSTKSGSSSSSRAIVPVKKPQSTVSHTDLMITLLSAGIVADIGLIIMGYATPSLRETSLYNSHNPSQFFTSRLQLICFNRDFSDLAEADQHCIWGRPEEVKKTLEEIKKKSEKDRDPLLRTRSLLTSSIDGEDHRGPGFIPSGTLLERVLYVEDVLNEDEESGETMAVMLGRIVTETCGEEEFKRQVGRAKKVIEEESKKKVAIKAEDKTVLDKVWNVLKTANEKTLKSNAELKIALAEFEEQLRKPGNEKIIQEAEKLYDRDYADFGGYNSLKNNFARNRIIGLTQLRRLSASDLQICFPGLHYSLNRADGRVIAKRIDIRHELGVLSGGAATYSLASNCHLDIYAGGRLLMGRDWRWGVHVAGCLENLCRAKTSRYSKLCSDWTIHQAVSPPRL